MYAFFTDVMSCVPLVIKGWELLHSAKLHTATVAWVYGDTQPIDATVVIESWSASCTTNLNVRCTVSILCVLSVSFACIGLTLKFWAWERLQRKKERHVVRNLHFMNEKLKQYWALEMPCPSCSCYGKMLPHLMFYYTDLRADRLKADPAAGI